MEIGKRVREINEDRSKDQEGAKASARIFESSFFDAILESSGDVEIPLHAVQATDIDLDQYEDYRKRLELLYGVEIPQDAVQAASDIVKSIKEAQILPTIGVAELLTEAASKLQKDFDSNSAEKDLDWFMFLFDRAFIEHKEIIKEKDVRMFDQPHVKEELDYVTCALKAFNKRWATPLEYHISMVRHECLKTLRQGIVAALSEISHWSSDLVAKEIRDLRGSLSTLLHTVDISFRRRRIVTSRIVAEVASLISGVPRNFFPPPFHLPLELLVQRLSQRLIGLDIQLRTIIKAMSIPKPESPRIYSFLLLGPPGQGKTALAEALAKEMFDDKILKYDVADLIGETFIEQIHRVDGSYGSSGLISNSILLFDNIDKANTGVWDIIQKILCSGSYVDGTGERVTFINVLILFTSSPMIFPKCGCVGYVLKSSFKPPFKELLKSGQGVKRSYCDCNLQDCLSEAEKWPGFFDSLDDVIVLPWLSVSHHMSIFRTQVRNAASLCGKQVVVYPSAAVFRYTWKKNLVKIIEEGVHFTKHLVVDVISGLCNVEDQSVVYVDLLLGSNELSFRTKKLSDMSVVHDYKAFKDSLRNSMFVYQIEKEQTDRIYNLSRAYFGLVQLLESKGESNSSVLSGLRDFLVIDHRLNIFNDRCQRAQVQLLADIVHERSKRSKYISEAEFSIMHSKLVEQDPPVRVVANTFLKSINHAYEPCHGATSFLVLGLGDMGKWLVDRLSRYFVADDGATMLFEVDLSTCMNPNSFFSCTCRNDPDLMLKKAILMRPFSVVVFYNLESAHQTVFTNIISILDDGLLFDNDGTVLDFRKSVIIFVSKLGNKSLIAKIVGGPNDLDTTTDKSSVGFRFELLNRVDEILLFNPFASDQHGGRLLMKECEHLVTSYPPMTDVLLDVFDNNLGGWSGDLTYTSLNVSRLNKERSVVCSLRKRLIKFDGTKHHWSQPWFIEDMANVKRYLEEKARRLNQMPTEVEI